MGIISRVANSTIKGFLYQFNLTLNSLLSASDETIIHVEGIIEDIDIINEMNTVSIQCKYHEEQETYTLSKIYKPILQMLKTHLSLKDDKIDYILYAYFPSEESRSIELVDDDILKILNTTNIDYISKYICEIFPPKDQELIDICNKQNKSIKDKELLKKYYQDYPLQISDEIRLFFNKHLKIIFAESYLKLEEKTKNKLIESGFTKNDVDELFYPNAIHKIAILSTNPCDDSRKISRKEFVNELKQIKKIAITRWTRELNNFKQLIISRRNQLSLNLNQNNRKRYFLINSKNIDNFNEEIVIFLKNYVDIYCHKPKLHEPALFCLSNSGNEMISDITARLYTKSVEVQTGFIGNKFFPEALLKNPERKVTGNWMQFKIRLCCENDEIIDLMNSNKPDDFFVINSYLSKKYELNDVNIEFLDIKNLNELQFLLKMTKELNSNGK